ARMLGAVGVRPRNLLDDRKRARAAERDHLAPRLELSEEEDVVDQLARLLDLLPRLLDELVDVRARQSRALEQHEHARERRAQLVGDRGSESGPQLLVRRQDRQLAEE